MWGLVASVTALSLAAACAAAGGAASSPNDGEKARAALRIVSLDPLTVRGTRFLPGERVKLLLSVGRARGKAARAERQGRFTVSFAVELHRCSSFVVQAFGVRGSRAMIDVTAPDCATPNVASPSSRPGSEPTFGLPYERP